MKKILFPAAAVGFTAFLFTNPGTAAAGCTRGLTLWYSAVLPSLLPFLILSGLLVKTGLFRYLNRFYAPILGRIFRISDEGCYALLTGFLCGFPMGAKVSADLVRDRLICAEEGSYLLGFCNNVSPAFFLNYICLLKLGYREIPWRTVFFFYAAPVLWGLISRPFWHFTCPRGKTGRAKQASLQRLTFPMLDACIMDSFSTVTRLGGYIILFAVLAELLMLLPVPPTALALLSAALEISCGADRLSALSLSPAPKTALITGFAAFGGFCVCAQTSSVLDGTPLRIRTWLSGRTVIVLLTLLPALLPPAAQALAGCW